MSFEREVKKRAEDKCELCGHSEPENLAVYEVPKTPEYIEGEDKFIYACTTCTSQFESDERDLNHWRCLNDSMWSTVAPVQVMAWRMLHRLKSGGWSQDLLDMMYMEEQQLEWADATGDAEDKSDALIHRDANGVDTPKRRQCSSYKRSKSERVEYDSETGNCSKTYFFGSRKCHFYRGKS